MRKLLDNKTVIAKELSRIFLLKVKFVLFPSQNRTTEEDDFSYQSKIKTGKEIRTGAPRTSALELLRQKSGDQEKRETPKAQKAPNKAQNTGTAQ